jgi:hypothetical protein
MLQKKWVPGIFLGVKGCRRVALTTSPPSFSRMSIKCGNLDVPKPNKRPRSVTGEYHRRCAFFLALVSSCLQWDEKQVCEYVRSILPLLSDFAAPNVHTLSFRDQLPKLGWMKVNWIWVDLYKLKGQDNLGGSGNGRKQCCQNPWTRGRAVAHNSWVGGRTRRPNYKVVMKETYKLMSPCNPTRLPYESISTPWNPITPAPIS